MFLFQTVWLKLNPLKTGVLQKLSANRVSRSKLIVLVYLLFLAVPLFKAPFTSRTESKIRMQRSITDRVTIFNKNLLEKRDINRPMLWLNTTTKLIRSIAAFQLPISFYN